MLMTRLMQLAASPVLALELINLEKVQQWIQLGGPFVIFGLLFACGLGLPLPEDIPLIIGGYYVGKGSMDIYTVSILAWTGIIGGDCCLYFLGRKYGHNITRVPFVGSHLTEARIAKAERWFNEWGIWVVAFGRLLAGIRGAMVVAAGITRFSFIKFIIADGLAALISGGLFVWLGYYIGKSVKDKNIREAIRPYEHWIIIGTIVIVVLAIIYIVWRSKRHKTIAEVVVEKIEEKTHAHDAQ